MQLSHSRHSSLTGLTLADYRDRIIREVDGVALRVGKLLREAKAVDPDDFNRWVEEELPFGLETARRLVAISVAYEKLPPEQVALLPRPWQAMYALKALPMSVIANGIEDGTITPKMTVREARKFAAGVSGRGSRVSRADVAAGLLMQFGAHELSPSVRHAVRAWLQRATAPDRREQVEGG